MSKFSNVLSEIKGVLAIDGLQQCHLLDKLLPDVIANCWTHEKRDFSDVLKAVDVKNPQSVRCSIAYKALQKIVLSPLKAKLHKD